MAEIEQWVKSATVQAIERWRVETTPQEHRAHLGASLIGRPCDRALWYGWRWVRRPAFDGRILRLFDRGQREEERFVEELRGIGAEVWPVDPDTGQQWRVSAHGGHFGGSLDAVCRGLPESTRPHVCEFKTHSAKSFAALESKGVRAAKPEHYAQMMIYCHLLEIDRALYLAVNKDTDALYSERFHADSKHAESLLNRAERIIFAWRPPSRLSEDADFWLCRFCEFSGICHGEAAPERNCRTCRASLPEPHGVWTCKRRRVLTVRSQRAGCEGWAPIEVR